MTLFVFLAGTARTRVVRPWFLIDMYGFRALLRACVVTSRSGLSGSLCCLGNRIFLGAVAAVVHAPLLLRLLYFVRLGDMNLSSQENRQRTAV